MSRLFTGGAFNYITFGAGSAPTVQGPITLAFLVKPATITGTHWWWTGRATSTHVWSILTDTSKLFMENDFGTGGPTPTVANWWWVVVTKATGSALPRWHLKNVTTGGAWSHANSSATVPNNTGPITNMLLGGDGSNVGTNMDGKGAVAAAWASALTDLAVEAACTLAASDLLAAAPSWMVRLNQASTATSVPDDTGHGGGQTALTGTSVDAEDPPGFNYALTTTVTKDVPETYRVLNAITKNTAETYRVLNSITKNTAETYRVLNAVQIDKTETYRVFNSITKNVAETYRVLGAVTADRAETYRVFNALVSDHAELYRVFASLVHDWSETYRVLNAGVVDRPENYRVLNAVTKNVVESYNVLSTTGVIKNVSEAYRVFNSVIRDTAESYRVLNARTSDYPEIYRVLNAATVTKAELYRVLNQLTLDRVELYNILGVTATKDVVERYRLLGARVIDLLERYDVGEVVPSDEPPTATALLGSLAVSVDLRPASVQLLPTRTVTADLDDVDG